MMNNFSVEQIKQRSILGVVTLTGRTFFLQMITFSGTFLLTIFLDPSVFGIFFIVSAFISFLSYFSDIGLAAALIQKKDVLTELDLRTTFTIQQILVLGLVVLSLLISWQVAHLYGLGNDGVWLLRALIISFFLSSLKTIPSIILERKLNFAKLVLPQIVETSLFYVVVVILAWQGLGLTSFTIAVLVRGISGLLVIYILAPWKIGFSFSTNVLRRLLVFGVPFQVNSILALIKDDLFTIFLGKVLPFSQVGYIGWAKKWTEAPLRLFMDSVIRVSFPAFSRLQKEKVVLTNAIEKALFFIGLFILPASICFAALIKPLVAIIPKYTKWEPAIILFYLFTVSVVFSSLSSPITNALNAIGKIRITLKLMIMWTLGTWTLVPLLISLIGYNGIGLGALILSLTLVITIYLAKKEIKFSFFNSIKKPLVLGLIQIAILLMQRLLIHNLYFQIVANIATTGFLLVIFIFFFSRKEVMPILEAVINHYVRKK